MKVSLIIELLVDLAKVGRSNVSESQPARAADGSRAQWGAIPGPVRALLVRLTEKAGTSAAMLDPASWPPADTAADYGEFFNTTLEATQGLQIAATDLRSLISAWAHKYHRPSPNFSALARAQGSTPQGLYKRYKPATIAAIDELLSDSPRVGVILFGFPSLEAADLEGLTPSIDRAIAVASGDYHDDIIYAISRSATVGDCSEARMQRLLIQNGIEPTAENIAKLDREFNNRRSGSSATRS